MFRSRDVESANTSKHTGIDPEGSDLAGSDVRSQSPRHCSFEEGLTQSTRTEASTRCARQHQVVYFGESLGAAVAVELATTHPPAALIIRSPFTSLPDVARVYYGLIPAKAVLWDEYPSRDRIGRVTSPVLVIAGAADSTVPVEQSRTLYETAPGPLELLIIADADHNHLALLAGDELVDAAVRFTDRYLTE